MLSLSLSLFRCCRHTVPAVTGGGGRGGKRRAISLSLSLQCMRCKQAGLPWPQSLRISVGPITASFFMYKLSLVCSPPILFHLPVHALDKWPSSPSFPPRNSDLEEAPFFFVTDKICALIVRINQRSLLQPKSGAEKRRRRRGKEEEKEEGGGVALLSLSISA